MFINLVFYKALIKIYIYFLKVKIFLLRKYFNKKFFCINSPAYTINLIYELYIKILLFLK